jgi:hypothetical protein
MRRSARFVRKVARQMCHRSSVALPGLFQAFSRRGVVVIDGTRNDGPLGCYTTPMWSIGGRRYDELTVYPHHPAFRQGDRVDFAFMLVTALGHELAHAYSSATGIEGTAGPDRRRHTEDFARIATRLGLHVSRFDDDPIGIYTPRLSNHGFALYRDLLVSVAVELHPEPLDGIGLAGPEGFTGSLWDSHRLILSAR